MMLKKVLRENKILLFTICYFIFYLCAFAWLEQRDVSIHIVYSKLDRMIPFCEYFIIPYVFWFVYMALTIIYFVSFCKERRECKQMLYSLCLGTVVFLLISLVYPNGHNLRPELTGNGFFIRAVKRLYQIDTATNILPSLHVFGTVVGSIALLKNQAVKKQKGIVWCVRICTVLITASTMFLKQHSVVDVILAVLLNVVCYILFYKLDLIKEEESEKCGRKKKYLRFPMP